MMLPSLAASTATKSASKVSLATSPAAKSCRILPFRQRTSFPVKLTLPGILFLLYVVLSDSALPDVVGRPKRLKIAQRHCLTDFIVPHATIVAEKLKSGERLNVVDMPAFTPVIFPGHAWLKLSLEMVHHLLSRVVNIF